MYIGSFWREREKASSKIKVLIRRRQRRLEKLELHQEMVFVAATIDCRALLSHVKLDFEFDSANSSGVVHSYPTESIATPVA